MIDFSVGSFSPGLLKKKSFGSGTGITASNVGSSVIYELQRI
jgi:hypothetical protein